MERNDSILGGALLLTAANLLLRLISIAFQVFLSVRIGAAGLGLMQLISTIGVFAMLAGTAGVRVTAMYLAAEEFGHRRLSGVRAAMRACLQYGILVSAVSGAALFFLSDFFAMEWLRDLRAGPSLRVMGLLLPFSCLCGIMTGYYTACSRIRQLVGIEIAERLVSVGLTVILLYLWAGDDLARACCAITFGSSAGCIFDFTLLYLRYRRDMRRAEHGRAAAHPHRPCALWRLDGGGHGGLWDDPWHGVPDPDVPGGHPLFRLRSAGTGAFTLPGHGTRPAGA